jgi:pyruvate,water dikinase
MLLKSASKVIYYRHKNWREIMRYVKFFNELSLSDISSVGGKNASLAEMYRYLMPLGVEVPNGFAITAEAYRYTLSHNKLDAEIGSLLEDLDANDVKALSSVGKKIRGLIENVSLPPDLQKEIDSAYEILSQEYGAKATDVAIRSSATAEDLPDASFAGQQSSYLNVSGTKRLTQSVIGCFASLFNDRAISYRSSRGYEHFKVALSVGVQKMVRSDKASSGIMFTLDTESGSDQVVLINSIWGLGENIVGGKVNPDEFQVFKPTLKEGKQTILKRQLGDKKLKLIYDENDLRNVSTSDEELNSFSLSNSEIIKLAEYAITIEEHYSKKAGTYRAMDIEWAKDGDSQKLFIVQARPETVQSQKSNASRTSYRLLPKEEKKVLVSGKAVGDKVGFGKVKLIRSMQEFHLFNKGDILVADITDPDWEPIMKISSALVTNRGGRTCHAAIVAREIGIPAIVGCSDATEVLNDGIEVTVSCCEGEEGRVYEGEVPFEVDEIDLKGIEKPKTKLFMNIANPEQAFSLAKLPNEGVGLARMEFIINHSVKAHPMALVALQKSQKVEEEETIRALFRAYKDPKDFFISKLCEGIGTIAAAFYPKPVIVRTSDFKSNEYKHMLGGAAFEQDEENPMIGFRGASRYNSERYKEAFGWECEALKIIREEMGLDNVRIMFPFVRTPQEGREAIKILNEKGLIQGANGLEVYAMCEIPSNVILADEFLKIFDGYSIGSNDLTQLILGVDRDSTLVSHIFDERDEAVRRMLKMAIEACKKEAKYIGICGQAPSDYPEITRFLVENEIDSISLNPDSLMKMTQVVLEIEKELEGKAK